MNFCANMCGILPSGILAKKNSSSNLGNLKKLFQTFGTSLYFSDAFASKHYFSVQ